MKYTLITLFLISICSTSYSCSFDIVPFCKTVNQNFPDEVILRGYFSEHSEKGSVFTRLETLRGDEERDIINVWNNIPFECTGTWLLEAKQMGDLNEEVIISLPLIDSTYFEYEEIGDYRVPASLWWNTHDVDLVGDSVVGRYITSYLGNIESILYDDFLMYIVNEGQCTITSTKDDENTRIKIYPTLVNDYITIEFEDDIVDSAVKVYGMDGSMMLSSRLYSRLSLGVLSKGMYIVVVQTRDNKCYHQKIVKL